MLNNITIINVIDNGIRGDFSHNNYNNYTIYTNIIA